MYGWHVFIVGGEERMHGDGSIFSIVVLTVYGWDVAIIGGEDGHDDGWINVDWVDLSDECMCVL